MDGTQGLGRGDPRLHHLAWSLWLQHGLAVGAALARRCGVGDWRRYAGDHEGHRGARSVRPGVYGLSRMRRIRLTEKEKGEGRSWQRQSTSPVRSQTSTPRSSGTAAIV